MGGRDTPSLGGAKLGILQPVPSLILPEGRIPPLAWADRDGVVTPCTKDNLSVALLNYSFGT